MDRMTHIHMDERTDIETDSWRKSKKDRMTHIQMDGRTDIVTDRWRNSKKD